MAGTTSDRDRRIQALIGAAPAVAAVAAGACVIAGAVGALQLPAWVEVILACVAAGFPILAVRRSREAQERHDQAEAECRDLRLSLSRDPLTGLMNRTAFNVALDALGRRGERDT